MKWVKLLGRFFLVVSMIAISIFGFFPQSASGSANRLDNPTKFSAFLDPFIEQKLREKKIPGAGFVMVKDGKVFYAKGYGYADLEKKKVVDVEKTQFRVASISKLVTTTAVMQLVERGLVDLHTDINQYLKKIQVPHFPNHPITLHHLLTHTSGLDDSRVNIKVKEATEALPPGQIDQRFIHPPVRLPGQLVSYSNIGIELIGNIISDVTEKPFSQYVAEHLFTPLNMKHSSFNQPTITDSLARGYRVMEGKNVAQPISYFHGGAFGSLRSTPLDLASFMIAHLEGGQVAGKRILQEKTIEQIHQQQVISGQPSEDGAYGFFTEQKNGRRAIFHEGKIAEATSILYLIPEEKIGFFLVYNHNFLNETGRPLIHEVKNAIMDRYFPNMEQVYALAEPLASFILPDPKKYVGIYRSTLSSEHTMEKIASLFFQVRLQANENGVLESKGIFKQFPVFLPTQENQFEMARTKLNVTFQENSKGEVSSFYIEGDTVSYERIPWYLSDYFHFALVLLFLVTAIITLWGIPIYLWKRWRNPTAYRFSLYTGLSGLSQLLFFIGIYHYLLKPMQSEFWGPLSEGIPWELLLLSLLPWLTLFLAAITTWKVWKHPSLHIMVRSYYFTIMVVSTAFFLFTWYWNLVWLSW